MKYNTLAKDIFNTLPLIVRAIKKSVKCELTHHQIKILNVINNGQSTLDGLATMFDVSLPTMSESIDVLLKKNLVKKIKSKKDGRIYNIILTSQAKRDVAVAHKKIMSALDKKLNILTNKEEKILFEAISILQKIFSTNKK